MEYESNLGQKILLVRIDSLFSLTLRRLNPWKACLHIMDMTILRMVTRDGAMSITLLPFFTEIELTRMIVDFTTAVTRCRVTPTFLTSMIHDSGMLDLLIYPPLNVLQEDLGLHFLE